MVGFLGKIKIINVTKYMLKIYLDKKLRGTLQSVLFLAINSRQVVIWLEKEREGIQRIGTG